MQSCELPPTGASCSTEVMWVMGRGALEEKRVSNARLKRELGVRLAFPTYREGLAAIAAGDLRPFA